MSKGSTSSVATMSDSNRAETPDEKHSIDESSAEVASQAKDPEATEKAPSPKIFSSDAPDGGVAAWLVVFGTWCASFCSFGWLNSTTSERRHNGLFANKQ